MVNDRRDNEKTSIDDQLLEIRNRINHYDFDEAQRLIVEARQSIEYLLDHDSVIQLALAESKIHMWMNNFEKLGPALAEARFRVMWCETPLVLAESLLELTNLEMSCNEYVNADAFLKKALQISRDNAFVFLELNALLQLSRLNRKRHLFDAALFLIEQALAGAAELNQPNDDTLLSEKYLILKSRGDFNDAFKISREMERQAREARNSDNLHLALLYQSDMFRIAGDIDNAFRHMELANKLPSESGVMSPDEMDIIGHIFLATEDYDNAVAWYHTCEAKVNKLRFFQKIPDIWLGFAQCWAGRQNYTKALEYLWQADEIIRGRYLDYWDTTISLLRLLDRVLPFIRFSEYTPLVKSVLARMDTPGDHIAGLRLDEKDRAELNRQIGEVIKTVRTNKVLMFTGKGVRIDLTTGEVFHDDQSPFSVLSQIQMMIFTHLVEKSPNPISNKQIVELYDPHNAEYVDVPRRGHYFISELRKKLGSQTIILTRRGSGYYIPD